MANKFEKKLKKYAIHNLSLMLILCYAFGYLIQMVNPDFMFYLTLNPYAILHGQVWRLLTWLIMPPATSNLFFTMVMLFFYYSIGTTLERVWGDYAYNVYIFTGILFTVVSAFLFMGYTTLVNPELLTIYGPASYYMAYSRIFSTYYVNMSIFLAYAMTFPNNMVLIFFFLPLRVKYLGIIYAILLGSEAINAPAAVRFAMAGSLLNAFLLFLKWMKKRGQIKAMRRRRQAFSEEMQGNKQWTRGTDGWMHPGQTQTQREYKSGENAKQTNYRHKCTICGRTDVSNPELDFRYCSKCEGNHEYCNDHIFSHVHMTYSGDKS